MRPTLPAMSSRTGAATRRGDIMLDIEIIEEPSALATDVVSVAEMKRHIGGITSVHDTLISEIIEDAVDKLGGFGGELNRTILPTTYKRYLDCFPGLDECLKPKPILIPYSPLISVTAITIEDGSSPDNEMDSDDYIVRKGMLVPEIHPVDAWPIVTTAPRAVSVTYRCGYAEYPKALKRMVKFLAAHYFENREATILEQGKTLIDRRTLFAMDDLRAALRIPVSYDDWNE